MDVQNLSQRDKKEIRNIPWPCRCFWVEKQAVRSRREGGPSPCTPHMPFTLCHVTSLQWIPRDSASLPGCLSEELLCSAFSQWLSKCFPFLTRYTPPGQAGCKPQEMAFAISSLPEDWKMRKITLQEDKVIWLPLVVLFKPTTTTKSIPHLPDPSGPLPGTLRALLHYAEAQPSPGQIPHWILTTALWSIIVSSIFQI